MFKRIVMIAGAAAVLVTAWVALRQQSPQATHAQTTAPRDDKALRILTANIRFADPKDGINEWPKRRTLLVETLRAQDAHIIGLQEVTPTQGVYLFKEMKDFSRWPVQKDDNVTLVESVNATFAALNSVLYRTDRFEFVDGASGLVIPEEPQNNPTENTYFSLAVLRDKEKLWPTLIVVNTHLRHNTRFAARCAARLRETIATYEKQHAGAQVIVTGDMNGDKAGRPYAEWTKQRDGMATLRDTFDYTKKKPGEQWGTYHAFTGKVSREWPTDLIFTAGPMTIAAPATLIRGEGDNGLWATDHFLVQTTLTPAASTTPK